LAEVSELHPTNDVHSHDAQALVALLAEMETPDFRFYERRAPTGLGGNFVYGPAFTRLMKLLYRSSIYIDPHASLPGDPPDRRPLFSIDESRLANLDRVRRYLVLLTRGERFCDGTMALEWDNGNLLAALRRFRELTSVTTDPPR
jgi:hypothetical protein